MRSRESDISQQEMRRVPAGWQTLAHEHCPLLLQSLIKILKQRLLRLLRVGPLEAVARSFESQEIGFDGRGPQLIDEPDGLFVGDVLVLGAVDTERRSRIRRDPVERTSLDVEITLRVEVAAEPEREDFVSIHALAVRLGEVARAINVHDASDGTRLVRVAADSLELRDISRYSKKLRQVSSGRATGRTDATWVDFVAGGVRAQPSYGRFGVMHGCRELMLWGESISHRRGYVTTFR